MRKAVRTVLYATNEDPPLRFIIVRLTKLDDIAEQVSPADTSVYTFCVPLGPRVVHALVCRQICGLLES